MTIAAAAPAERGAGGGATERAHLQTASGSPRFQIPSLPHRRAPPFTAATMRPPPRYGGGDETTFTPASVKLAKHARVIRARRALSRHPSAFVRLV